jgi:hypothetical protein
VLVAKRFIPSSLTAAYGLELQAIMKIGQISQHEELLDAEGSQWARQLMGVSRRLSAARLRTHGRAGRTIFPPIILVQSSLSHFYLVSSSTLLLVSMTAVALKAPPVPRLVDSELATSDNILA